MQRCKWIFILLISLPFLVVAQNMPLPVNYQFQLMLKVLAYEGRLNQDPQSAINIAVIYSGDPASVKVRKEFKQIYEQTPIKAIGKKQLVLFEHKYKSVNELSQFIQANNINVLYITPGMDMYLKELKDFSIQNNLVAITGVPEYVNNHFIMVGLNVFNKKPKIMVNLEIAKSAGAKFSANLLKLCQVIRE